MKIRIMLALASVSVCCVPAGAQVISNSSFEAGLTGWTVGGTNRVAAITGADITGAGANVTAPDGNNFAVLSTGPGDRGGAAFRIDNNTVDDNDIATLSITVSIPFRPAVLAFDWTYPSSEQDQAAQYDDLAEVMVYQGAPPADPTTTGRLFAVSSPRNGTNNSNSNFPDAHKLADTQTTWTINGGATGGTQLRFRVPAWRRACVPIPLPDAAPPFTRTIRFRVADQVDRQFDSALFLDRVEVRAACDATPLEHVTQITETTGSQLSVKGGGLNFRPVQTTHVAADPTGTVFAVASNANLDGSNPNLIPSVFMRVGGGGWSRVTGLTMQDRGSIQSLNVSGQPTTGSGQISGRYVAIAARLTETDNTEIYLWDRNSSVLTTITDTSGCTNENPAINRKGDVIAFESTCATLTGAGANRHVVAWTGGATNAVSSISGTGACIARSPSVNHNSNNSANSLDGRYVVYESNCNFGSNADGNFEIFRFNRNTSSRRQITTTTSPVLNASPQIDKDDVGRNVYFLSTGNFAGNNADGSMEVYRFQCNNNVDCTGSSGGSSGFFQWTDNVSTSYAVGFKRMFNPNPANAGDVTNERIAFERLDLLTGASEVVYREGATASTERVMTIANGTPSLTVGDDSGVPVIGLVSAGDLINLNADENSEAYSVRVQ